MADIDPKSKVSSDVNEGIKNLKNFTNATQSQRDAIKEVVDVFKQLNKSYEKINDYSNSLSKSTLNTAKLQRELEKATENKLKAERQLATFHQGQTKQFNKDLNAELKLQEKIRSGLLDKNQLKKAYNYLSTLQNDLEYQMYKTSLQSVKQAEEGVDAAQKRYKSEKEIEKSLGKTGAAIKLLNKYTGIGKELYSKMVEEAREGEKTTKNWVIGLTAATLTLAGMGKAFNKVTGKMGEMVGVKGGGAIGNMASNVTGLISKIPILGPVIGGVVDSFANLLDFAVETGSKIQQMGREIGLSKVQSIQLNNQFSTFATNSGKAYLNSERLFKTFLDISNVLETNNQISNENLQTQYELNKFLGVDAQTSAEIEKSSAITGRNSKDIAQSIFSQTKNLQRATGISFNFQKILKEASSLGGVLGLTFAKYPEKITKTMLSTKALGLEIKQLDGMADSFLDFESSISKEFEAQLLTGKEINLAKAREAFLNNDLATAAQEITKQVGDSNEFLKMNRIQQESLAGAMGMSRDQMADMLKQQEYLSKLGAKDVKDLHEKVRLLREQGKEQEAINLLGDKEAYNKIVTATASEDLSGFIEKIKQSFADLVANSKLTDFVQGIIGWLSEPDHIMYLVHKIRDVFAGIVSAVGAVMGGIMKAMNFFGAGIDTNLISMVEDAGSAIKGANLGSLSIGGAAAADKAGSSKAGGAGNSAGGATGGSSTKFVAAQTKVQIDGKNAFDIVWIANQESGQGDQQITTKYKSNAH